MPPVPIISDKQTLTWLPASGAAPADEVDLSCYVTEPPADEVGFDTVSTPTLCNPQASQVKVGERTLTLSLLWTDDWATVIEPLFGESGTLTWYPAGETKAGYEYGVTWPSTYGMAAPFGEAIAVEVQLGVSSRSPVAAVPPPGP
jgi:hypothetical protein